jgi:hypothetical protein
MLKNLQPQFAPGRLSGKPASIQSNMMVKEA